jgi:hypothetical protein
MIFDARSVSRRCTTVVRREARENVAPSIAESPPPTAQSACCEKKPSQVAQRRGPWARLFGQPELDTPVAAMSARLDGPSSVVMITASTIDSGHVAANRLRAEALGLAAHVRHQIRPMMPSESGRLLDGVVA